MHRLGIYFGGGIDGIFSIVILVGLGKLIRLFSGTTRKALKRVRVGVVLEMVADICLIAPVLGNVVACVISVVWAIIYMVPSERSAKQAISLGVRALISCGSQ